MAKASNKLDLQRPLEQAAEYAAEDADITLRLFYQFTRRLAVEPSLQSIYQDLELPVMHVLREMENHEHYSIARY